MKIEHVHEGIRYTLSNECHRQGEFVYPIAFGRQTEDGWILHDFDWKIASIGFPACPHTIKSIEKVKPKEVLVRTNFGYGAHDSYFKIIKAERQMLVSEDDMFPRWEWQIINITELNIKPTNPSYPF